ncbi:MAG: helix-turn-helix domain-containing protein [Deltaproteobacteria bacterium]|nr:helix-turn-helix domain-containing protein [Deltaproteobacteria bacterium]MBW2378346.1 helix-turn-helix domain-containing protein [Deltaproteobacteria bacterium]
MKFTEKTRGEVLGAMRIGVSHVRAAVAAGVSERTLYRWLKKGEDDETAGRRTAHARFLKAFRETEAQVLGQIESNVMQASAEDWRAGAWILSKKLPGQYGGLEKVAKQAMAAELLDFAQKRCTPEIYQGLLDALMHYGDEDIDPGALPAPAS